MKKYRLFSTIYLVAALLLSACSQDELAENSTALPEGEYPLQIGSVSLTAEVSEQPWTRVAESTDGMSSEFKAGDAIGVSLNGETATYTYNGNTWTSETPLYWKDKQPATVTAWYPVEEENMDFRNSSLLERQTTCHRHGLVSRRGRNRLHTAKCKRTDLLAESRWRRSQLRYPR